jgi:hypothetical protein
MIYFDIINSYVESLPQKLELKLCQNMILKTTYVTTFAHIYASRDYMTLKSVKACYFVPLNTHGFSYKCHLQLVSSMITIIFTTNMEDIQWFIFLFLNQNYNSFDYVIVAMFQT